LDQIAFSNVIDLEPVLQRGIPMHGWRDRLYRKNVLCCRFTCELRADKVIQ